MMDLRDRKAKIAVLVAVAVALAGVTLLLCSQHDEDGTLFFVSDPENSSRTSPDRTCVFVFTGSEAENLVWHFGDGTVSYEVTPTHTYENNGVYEVQCTAVNDSGETTSSYSMTVECREPTAWDIASEYSAELLPATASVIAMVTALALTGDRI